MDLRYPKLNFVSLAIEESKIHVTLCCVDVSLCSIICLVLVIVPKAAEEFPKSCLSSCATFHSPGHDTWYMMHATDT